MANTIKVDAVLDASRINKGVDGINNKLGGLQGSIGKVGNVLKGMAAAGLAAFAGAGIVDAIKGTIGAASDLNETVSKTQTIFGKASPDILKFGENASKSLGISKNEALQAVSGFGNFFNQIGIGTAESAKLSTNFVKLSSDLASFNNADPAKVMEALQGATRGEYDSLQQFIPTVNAAKVQTEALALSHKKSADALTDADKARALSILVTKGMSKAQGDFARTSTGLANQQRILSARFKDAQAQLGEKLLPIATKVVTFFNTGFGPAMAKLGTTLGPVGKVLGDIAGFVKKNLDFFVPFAGTILTVVAALKVWTIAQAALNFVLTANPIGLVVVAIAALVGGIIYAYKNSEKFRNVVNAAFGAIKTAVIGVVNFFKNLPGNISKAVGNLTSTLKNKAVDLIGGFIKGYIGAYVAVGKFFGSLAVSVAKAVGNVASSLAQKGRDFINGLGGGVNSSWKSVSGFFGDVPGKVKSAIGTVSSTLYSAGQNLLEGMIDGLKSMAGRLASAALAPVKDAVSGVKNFLGINSPSRLFKGIGINVTQGLVDGLGKTSGVVRAAAGMSTAITDGFTAPKLGFSTAGSGASALGNVYQITVNVPLGADPSEAGRQIVQAVKQYENRNGKVFSS